MAYEFDNKIWVINSDGSNATQVSQPGSESWDGTPTISADGSTIAFERGGQDPGIYVVAATGSSESRVSSDDPLDGGHCDAQPEISADGKKIVFSHMLPLDEESCNANESEIWTMSTNGNDRTRLASSPGSHFDPTWSPDGSQVAFTSTRTGLGVYTMSASGGTMTKRASDGRTPSWSGSSIAYYVYTGGSQGGSVYLMNSDGSNVTYVTDGYQPSLSIDEETIAFTGWDRGGDFMGADVVVANADGTGEAFVTDGAGPDMTSAARVPGDDPPDDPPPPVEPDLDPAEFRPNLYFDTSERWRPLDVEAFLAEGQHQVCDASSCTPISGTESLVPFSGEEHYLEIAGEGDGSDYSSPYFFCLLDGFADCDTGPLSKAYYRFASDSTTYRYIDYWYFYRYNDSPAIGDAPTPEDLRHEGDWESVTVAIPPGSDPQTFDFVTFSQHGKWFNYLRDALRCDGGPVGSCGTDTSPAGARVSGFVANRSHAVYPRTCSAVEAPGGGQVNCGQDGSELPEGGGYDGERAWGNNDDSSALEQFPDDGEQNAWQYWLGFWGSTGAGGASSPKSPGHQEPHWSNPGAFECPQQDAPPACSSFASPLVDACLQPEVDQTCPLPADGASPTIATADKCRSWFGQGVTAVVCDSDQLARAHRSGDLSADRPSVFGALDGRVEAMAPGIAQVVGHDLVPGEVIRLEDRMGHDETLLVRARSASGLVEARFQSQQFEGQLKIDVSTTHAGRPVVTLRANGAAIAADRTRFFGSNNE